MVKNFFKIKQNEDDLKVLQGQTGAYYLYVHIEFQPI